MVEEDVVSQEGVLPIISFEERARDIRLSREKQAAKEQALSAFAEALIGVKPPQIFVFFVEKERGSHKYEIWLQTPARQTSEAQALGEIVGNGFSREVFDRQVLLVGKEETWRFRRLTYAEEGVLYSLPGADGKNGTNGATKRVAELLNIIDPQPMTRELRVVSAPEKVQFMGAYFARRKGGSGRELETDWINQTNIVDAIIKERRVLRWRSPH